MHECTHVAWMMSPSTQHLCALLRDCTSSHAQHLRSGAGRAWLRPLTVAGVGGPRLAEAACVAGANPQRTLLRRLNRSMRSMFCVFTAHGYDLAL